MMTTKLISSVPVEGFWAVSVDGEGNQYKEKVVLLLTIQVSDSEHPEDDFARFKYVTHDEILSEGFTDLDSGLPFNTNFYIGIISDNETQIDLKPEEHLAIPSWKKKN